MFSRVFEFEHRLIRPLSRVQHYLHFHTKRMFKGILPSKRISSSDFTMITNLGDLNVNGKENVAAIPPASKSARPALSKTKAPTQLYEKKRKADGKKGKITRDQIGAEQEGPGMNQAFDRLLVSQPCPHPTRP